MNKKKSAEEIREAAACYFAGCTSFLDAQGDFCVRGKPPTLSGLALALGFSDKKELLHFDGCAEVRKEVARAVARCEEYAETRLYDKDGLNGAKFSLQYGFDGWGAQSRESREKMEVTVELIDDE